MSHLKWPFKDPDEVLDYTINWYGRLAGDTIVTSTWEIFPSGGTLNHDSDSIGSGGPDNSTLTVANTATTIWLSGGATGDTYTITNHIVTAGNRHEDQSVRLQIKDK